MSDDRRRELETQLSAYLDGELELAERREVEALLAADEGARILLKQLQATAEAVRSLPRARASDRLIESLRSRMERQSLLEGRPAPLRPAVAGRSYARWIAAAAVIVLAAGTGYLMWPWARDQINRPGQQYAMRGDESDLVPPAERGRSARVPTSDLDNRTVDEPPPPALPAELAARSDVSVIAEGSGATEKTDLTGDKEAPTSDRAGAFASAPGRSEADLMHERFGEEEKVASRGMVADAIAVPAAAPALSDAAVEGHAQIQEDRSAVAEDVPAHTTVLEASFADAASQREAVERLRDDYAFRPVSADQPHGEAATLEVRVPDAESARRVVSSLEQALTAGNLRVVSRGERLGRETRSRGQGADVHDARRKSGLHAGVTRSDDSFARRIAEPAQKPPVAAMERIRPNRPSESPLSFGMVDSPRAAEQASTRPVDLDSDDRGRRAPAAPASGRIAGYGAFGDSSEAPLAGSAPAAAAARRSARPNQPARELTSGASIAGGATRPSTGLGGQSHLGFYGGGPQTSAQNVVRLYVRIEPPATAPAAETRPASDE